VAPPPGLEWTSDHYERFWSAAEELGMPIGMHINSGFGAYVNNSPDKHNSPMEVAARQTYVHKATAMQTTAELILSGVFERHPLLRVILAEFDCGWIPFFLEDMDRKVWSGSTGRNKDLGLRMLPSEYFTQSVFSTLIQDGVGGYLLDRWGEDNFLFANDYPHPGGIWPFSDETIALTMPNLAGEKRKKVLGETLARIYGQPLPAPVDRGLSLDFDPATWPRPWLKTPDNFTFDKPEFGFAEAALP
jgi:predicted TIM-barrel fold metal-dependent hydrolase